MLDPKANESAGILIVDPKRSFVSVVGKDSGFQGSFLSLGHWIWPLLDKITQTSSPRRANGIDTLNFVSTDLVPDDINFFGVLIVPPFHSKICMD